MLTEQLQTATAPAGVDGDADKAVPAAVSDAKKPVPAGASDGATRAAAAETTEITVGTRSARPRAADRHCRGGGLRAAAAVAGLAPGVKIAWWSVGATPSFPF